MAGEDKLHTSHSTNGTNLNVDTATEVNTLQWINVIYVLNGTDVKLYVDSVEVAANSFNSLLPQKNNGDLYIGMGPATSNPSFVGFIDDIQVYNRALSPAELGQILPTLPIGTVQFAGVSDQVNEDAGSPNITLERTRASDEALTVYVGFDATVSSAAMGLSGDMTPASNPADLAFTDESLRVSGKGIPVTWAAGEKGPKSFSLILDDADDGIREGTEIARFVINDLNGAKAGENQQFNLRLLDVTPNPYGNFSVSIDGLGSKRIPENGAAQEICFVRESGSTGEVTVNYQVSGDAVVDVDFTHVGAVVPAGNTGSLTFADGQSANQCISIQPINSPAIGEPDKTYSVEITSISPANPAHDPLLTEQRVANLVIYDWAPGEFAFSAASYSCKEPNTREHVVVKPTEAELECMLAVKRTKTGNTAPAATINVNAVNRNASGISYTHSSSLTWPAINSENPINSELETQFIEFTIVDNNVQDDDLIVDLSLQSGSIEDITQGIAELTIVDVTEPSLVTITSPSVVNEGQTINYTVTRSGNDQTEFNIDYEVTVNPTLPKPLEHYIDLANSSPLSGVFNFTKGANNQRTLSYITKNTLENQSDYFLEVLLDNPQPEEPANNIVALGLYNNAGTVANNVTGSTEVKNIRENIASQYTLTVKDDGAIGDNTTHTVTHSDGMLADLGNYYASKKAQVPGHRSLELSFKLPRNLDIPSNAAYEWTLLNAAGTASAQWNDGVGNQTNANGQFTSNRQGSLNYNPADGLNLVTNVKLPFVLASQDFRLQLTITGNGPNGDGTKNFTRDFAFTVDPLFRRLENDGKTGCLRATGGNVLPSCDESGSETGEWPDIRWTWNSDKNALISKDNNNCFTLEPAGWEGLLYRTYRAPSTSSCDQSSSKIITFNESKEMHVSGERVCADGREAGLKRGGNCGGEGKWTWLD